jgi:UDP-glucose 4-epimerase
VGVVISVRREKTCNVKALITGGAGFIGSHLADLLLEQGHSVIALDNLSTGQHRNVEHLLGRTDFEFVLGSILNADLVDDCVSRSDVVFHLAAAVGVNLIVEKPLESLATNIRGSEIVFEKAHKHGAKVLVTSTSEIYGKNTSDRLGEEDDRILGSPLKSRWSYSEAKAIEEILAYTYHRQKGLDTYIVRLFNTVGPRQTGHYGMVIPRFVSQAVRGEAVTVYGDGAQTRCFCYVGDVVKALLALVEHPEAVGRVFNIGGNDEISIDALAHRVIELAGSDSKVRYVPYEEAYEEGFEDMQRRVPDTTRARELIGFQPSAGLDDIIRMVVDYQRA